MIQSRNWNRESPGRWAGQDKKPITEDTVSHRYPRELLVLDRLLW